MLLTSSSITAHSATLSWKGGSATEFNVYYKVSSDSTYTAEFSITDTFLTITNLLGSSLYEWYVVSVCSGDSSVSDIASFYTNCSAIETLPYFTDFENEIANTLLPYCWTRGSDNSSYPYINYDSYQGVQGLYFYSSQPNTVSLPEVNTTAIQLTDARLTFYAKGYGDGVVLQVGVMTNPNQTSTFVQVGSNISLTTSWQSYEVSLANYTGTGTYVALRNISSSLYVDNVTLEYLPSCNRPEQVFLQNVDSTEATISWTAAAGQSNWEVALTTAGVSPDSVNAISSGTNSYTIPNLTPNTTYNVYVRTDCGTEYSAWSNALTFNTLLHAPATLPYSCDFENAAENAAWTILNGSETNAWYINTASNHTTNGLYGLYISFNNGTNYGYDDGSSSYVWAYRDIQFSNANEFVLSFDWNGNGESNYDYLRVFIANPTPVTAGNITPPSGATTLGTFNSASDWVHEDIILGNEYNNATKRLYFFWHNDNSMGTNPPASVDNITIMPVNCARPTGLTVSDVSISSATITINPASTSDYEWEIQYGTSDTTMVTMQIAILAGMGSMCLSAQSLTVANGTQSNYYIPFYGYWMDEAQHNQIIYPASLLTNLTGESITGLVFYFETPPTTDWMASTTIKLGVTQNTSFSSVAFDASTTTQVYNGSINISGNMLTILFSTPFTYTGGNLLIDITTQAGTFSDASFLGITQSGSSLYSYPSATDLQNFLPKTTFLYGCLYANPRWFHAHW